MLPSKHFRFGWRYEDVLKKFEAGLGPTSWRLEKVPKSVTFSKRQKTLDVHKTSLRRVGLTQTSWKRYLHVLKTTGRRLQSVLKTLWVRLKDDSTCPRCRLLQTSVRRHKGVTKLRFADLKHIQTSIKRFQILTSFRRTIDIEKTSKRPCQHPHQTLWPSPNVIQTSCKRLMATSLYNFLSSESVTHSANATFITPRRRKVEDI